MVASRILFAILCLTALSGCAACLPGQTKLDKGMIEQTASARMLSGPGNVTTR
jgi:hypothetical protein